jgi:hypothetical protein
MANDTKDIAEDNRFYADPSPDFIVSSAALADLIRRVEILEAHLTGANDPLWGPCTRCGYGKFKSARRPVCCPRCHSAYWDREPRNVTARRPGDAPAKSWVGRATGRGRGRNKVVVPVAATTLPIAAQAPLISPPPRIDADPVVITPPPMPQEPRMSLAEQLRAMVAMPAPVLEVETPVDPRQHVAQMPDAVVESILATGEVPTYDEIKAAREDSNANVPEAPVVNRPTDPNLQARKDAFFAGFPLPESETQPEAAPFVAPSFADKIADDKKDDPFWK